MRKFFVLTTASMFGMALFVGRVTAGLVVDTAPAWTRPTSVAQALATSTTLSEWDGFTTTSGPNAPNVSFNPNGTGNVLDLAAPGDGAFLTGSDIYSFSASLKPEVTVPGYGVAGNTLNVQVQVQSFGSAIDTSDLTINGVKASTLAGYSFQQTYNDGGSNFGGFGTAYKIDDLWTFSLPDTSALKLDFGWNATSAALQSIVLDTQSVAAVTAPPTGPSQPTDPGAPSAVPLPAAAPMGLMAFGVLTLLRKRWLRIA